MLPGNLSGCCAEYCGAEHAWMRFRGHRAVAGGGLERGRTATIPAARPGGRSAARRGRKSFQPDDVCQLPRHHRDVPRAGTVGPDLTHLATRQPWRAGVLANTPEQPGSLAKNPAESNPAASCRILNWRKPGRRWRTFLEHEMNDLARRSSRPTPGGMQARHKRLVWLGRHGGPQAHRHSLSADDLCFLIAGGVEALLMRMQLARPNNHFLSPGRLQSDLHHARHDHDLPGGDAGVDRLRAITWCR